MKLEIEDEKLLKVMITRLVKSGPFQKLFKETIEQSIKFYSNEFTEIAYKKLLKENNQIK